MSAYAYPAPENPKVEPCPDCGSMKSVGSQHHAALLLSFDGPKCDHGRPQYTKCNGERCPPPCCWEGA